MWAQLIKMRVKPGRENDLSDMFDQLNAIEQPGSGLVRATGMQDQSDPAQAYILVVFESEELARARERDPRRQDGLKILQATMADLFDGAPEFVDLTVVQETTP